MSFKSVWGFDPDEVSRAQTGPAEEIVELDCWQDLAEDWKARLPLSAVAQIYELKKMFRL